MTIYYTWVEQFSKKFPDVHINEYLEFVFTHSTTKCAGSTDHHHVLPKWAFPEYSNLSLNPWNGAHLLHSDHIKAHIILAKCWSVFQNTAVINRLYDMIPSIDDEKFLDELKNVIQQDRLLRSARQKDLVEQGLHVFLQDEIRRMVIVREKEKYANGVGNLSPDRMNEKYGVSNIMQLPEVAQSVTIEKKQTLLQKYGVQHNWDMPGVRAEITKKHKENCMQKHGVEHPNQLPESKKRLAEYWEENNPMFVEEHVAAYKTTMKEKYGVENPAQDPEIMKRIIQTRKEKEMLRPKKIWYRNVNTLQSVIVREGTDDENFVLRLGFIKGRGIVGYSSTRVELLRKIQHGS